MARAKANVEQAYPVVGVLEHLDATLTGNHSHSQKFELAGAKTNVEQVFPVVGVLEQLDDTLAVLEARLPQFFRGVRDLYYGKLRGV